MGVKVAKFGGSSVADAGQLRKVLAIVRADAERRVVVVSAPGKRTAKDAKITDLLYRCNSCASNSGDFEAAFEVIAERFREIVAQLGVGVAIEAELDSVRAGILAGKGADFAASRGEYLSARIAAALLGAEFVDAADIIRFDANGRLLVSETDKAVAERLRSGRPSVVPGFYGALPDGSTKTFSRGGSDITGALLARGIHADVYENWTDVSGVLMADPRIVPGARTIPSLNYRELRELAYMGANVLHEESVFPVVDVNIPVHVCNTNAPEDEGTRIVKNVEGTPSAVTGIAGRKGYTVISLEKNLMNSEIGFGRRLLSILEGHGVSFEHMPTGIDAVSLVVESAYLNERTLSAVLQEIQRSCRPDNLVVEQNMALVATVGRGMQSTPGVAGRLFGALAAANVNVRMIDQGSGINIIVGVDETDYETAIRAIYGAFAV